MYGLKLLFRVCCTLLMLSVCGYRLAARARLPKAGTVKCTSWWDRQPDSVAWSRFRRPCGAAVSWPATSPDWTRRPFAWVRTRRCPPYWCCRANRARWLRATGSPGLSSDSSKRLTGGAAGLGCSGACCPGQDSNCRYRGSLTDQCWTQRQLCKRWASGTCSAIRRRTCAASTDCTTCTYPTCCKWTRSVRAARTRSARGITWKRILLHRSGWAAPVVTKTVKTLAARAVTRRPFAVAARKAVAGSATPTTCRCTVRIRICRWTCGPDRRDFRTCRDSGSTGRFCIWSGTTPRAWSSTWAGLTRDCCRDPLLYTERSYNNY